jgi:trehalose/maltose transport system permease protein
LTKLASRWWNAETGEVKYESAVSILPHEPLRFRPVNQFTLWGTRYVLGATDPAFVLAVWDTVVFGVSTVFLELRAGHRGGAVGQHQISKGAG